MEILFFLVILAIQFAYQIHKAINKKKSTQQKQAQEVQSENDMSDVSVSSDKYTADAYKVDEKKKVSDLYEELFGFVSSNYEGEFDRTTKTKSQTINPNDITTETINNEPSSHYEYYSEGLSESQKSDQENDYFSYDDKYEEEYSPTKYSESEEPPSSSSEEVVLSSNVKSSKNEKPKSQTLSTRALIRQQIGSTENLKNAWRIKFILDPPPGLLGKRNFF